MAELKLDFQEYVTLKDDTVVGIHKVTLINASGDTVTVPMMAHSTNGASVSQLRDSNDASASVSSSDQYTVTLSGTVGEKVTFVTLHRGSLNFGYESATLVVP